MKVLWFSVTPSLYKSYSNPHNGGGWISSLEAEVRKCKYINLSIAFVLGKEDRKEEIDNVTYYSISNEKNNLQKCLSIVNDVKPDIIQIFGSENDFGQICNHTKIPIVIHMQGSIPPYHNALFPIGMNIYDFVFGKGLSWRSRLMGLLSERSFRKRAKKEIAIIQSCNYFMGRTEWDKSIVNLFNPTAKYFHQEEALRDVFIDCDLKWRYNADEKIRITSVISNPWYKGVDVILKTAKLLCEYTNLKFEWNIYGVSDIKFYEKKYNINPDEVSVKAMGSVSKEELIDALIKTNCYVHPSYIENSPNSICEAQILGLPIIATNVGGISSIIKDNHSGILVPANDPYTLASMIQKLTQSEEISTRLGNSAYVQAKERHNPIKIRESLINIYNNIITNDEFDCKCS